MKHDLIRDDQRLTGAKGRFGYVIAIYDDGYGPLWIHRDSMGISGIVRAQTWTDAYGICEDEFFPEADETLEELVREYGYRREHVKMVLDLRARQQERPATAADYTDNGRLPVGMFIRWETVETPDPDAWADNELFREAFGFRPNGPRAGKRPDGSPRDPIGHGIYAKDLNGDSLDLLTPELVAELGITLEIENH